MTQILHGSLIFIVEKRYFSIKVEGPLFIDKNMIFSKKFFWVHDFRNNAIFFWGGRGAGFIKILHWIAGGGRGGGKDGPKKDRIKFERSLSGK